MASLGVLALATFVETQGLVDLKGLAAGAADLGRGPKNIKNRIFNFFIKSAFSGVLGVQNRLEIV